MNTKMCDFIPSRAAYLFSDYHAVACLLAARNILSLCLQPARIYGCDIFLWHYLRAIRIIYVNFRLDYSNISTSHDIKRLRSFQFNVFREQKIALK